MRKDTIHSLLIIALICSISLSGCGAKEKEDAVIEETASAMPTIDAEEIPLEQKFTEYIDVTLEKETETEEETVPETTLESETDPIVTEEPVKEQDKPSSDSGSHSVGGGSSGGSSSGGTSADTPQDTEEVTEETPEPILDVDLMLVRIDDKEFDILQDDINTISEKTSVVATEEDMGMQIEDVFVYSGKGYGVNSEELKLSKTYFEPVSAEDNNGMSKGLYVALTDEEKAELTEKYQNGENPLDTFTDEVFFYGDVRLGMLKENVEEILGRGKQFYGTLYFAYRTEENTMLISYGTDGRMAESIYLLNNNAYEEGVLS